MLVEVALLFKDRYNASEMVLAILKVHTQQTVVIKM